MEGLEEIFSAEGQTKWFFGTKHFMDHHPFGIEPAGLNLTFLSQVLSKCFHLISI
jgi:hypothetical protein